MEEIDSARLRRLRLRRVLEEGPSVRRYPKPSPESAWRYS